MLTVETSGGVLVHAALLAMAILLLGVVRLADRRTAPATGRRWRNASLASVAMLGIALVAAILLTWGGASRLLAAALAWYATLLACVVLLTLICLPALNGPRRLGFFALICPGDCRRLRLPAGCLDDATTRWKSGAGRAHMAGSADKCDRHDRERNRPRPSVPPSAGGVDAPRGRGRDSGSRCSGRSRLFTGRLALGTDGYASGAGILSRRHAVLP